MRPRDAPVRWLSKPGNASAADQYICSGVSLFIVSPICIMHIEGHAMSENKNVQDTHISEQMKALHGALIRVVGALNRPRNDEEWYCRAGDTARSCAIFDPCGIERLGPIGVVELAETCRS